MTEVAVQSRFVKGRTSILNAARKAAVNAVIQGLLETAANTVLSVAQETGAMRVGYARALEKTAFRVTTAKAKIVIKGTEVLRYIETIGGDVAPYIVHHIRQSSQFNPDFRGGYTNPTTRGTRPIDMNDVMFEIHDQVRKRLKKEMRKQGLATR